MRYIGNHYGHITYTVHGPSRAMIGAAAGVYIDAAHNGYGIRTTPPRARCVREEAPIGLLDGLMERVSTRSSSRVTHAHM